MAARPTSCRTKRTQCSHRPNRRKECCDHGAAADRASHERTRAARWANMWPWVPPSRIRTTVSRTHRATPKKGGARYTAPSCTDSRTSQTESQTIQAIHRTLNTDKHRKSPLNALDSGPKQSATSCRSGNSQYDSRTVPQVPLWPTTIHRSTTLNARTAAS
jgi:hypothetical protein